MLFEDADAELRVFIPLINDEFVFVSAAVPSASCVFLSMESRNKAIKLGAAIFVVASLRWKYIVTSDIITRIGINSTTTVAACTSK